MRALRAAGELGENGETLRILWTKALPPKDESREPLGYRYLTLSGLKQFDRVTRRIFTQNLHSTRTGYDLIAENDTFLAQFRN